MEEATWNNAAGTIGHDVLEKQLAEIENCRGQLHELIDRRIDMFIQNMAHGQQTDGSHSLPLSVPPAIFKGKKPIAVMFPDGTQVMTPTWKKAVTAIMQDCNTDPARHESMLWLRGRINGNFRTLLNQEPDQMDAPLKIDEGLYLESKFDTEALLHVLTTKVLDAVGYDYSGITLTYRVPQQQAAAPAVPEHPEGEGPIQGMCMQM